MLKEGILRVRMLGEFSMTWEGNEICTSSKSPDAQFTRLLQLLLHNRKEGVERTKLQTLLFDDSNSDDVHHLLRSVMYNARKKLEGSCLPDVKYIIFKDGRYYWTEEIPVRLDTEDFEELCAAAAAENDEDTKLKKCMAAIEVYKGGFLPNQTRLTWVAAEEYKYNDLFTRCVEDAAEILRNKKDYAGIERLGHRASVVCPLNEWEYLILEAYLFTGRMQEARDLHERTLDQYRKRLGSVAAAEYTDMMDQLLSRSEAAYQDLEDIAAIMRSGQDGPGSDTGVYYCSFPVFYGIYHMTELAGDLFVASPYLMLCNISRQGIRNMLDDDAFEKRSERAKRAILESAGNATAVCRYGKGQFLIMVLNGSSEVCSELKTRIIRKYRTKRNNENELTFSILPMGGQINYEVIRNNR